VIKIVFFSHPYLQNYVSSSRVNFRVHSRGDEDFFFVVNRFELVWEEMTDIQVTLFALALVKTFRSTRISLFICVEQKERQGFAIERLKRDFRGPGVQFRYQDLYAALPVVNFKAVELVIPGPAVDSCGSIDDVVGGLIDDGFSL